LISAIQKNKYDTDLIRRFADDLERHIRFEERELFNHLQNIIPPDDSEEIAARTSNNDKEPNEKWKDVFWEEK
jgi:hemerythrin-like domain-containing protein